MPLAASVAVPAPPCFNRVRNGRFWHSPARLLAARTIVLLVTVVCSAAASADATAPASNFLKLTKEQRYWWIHGAVTTTAHLIAMHDKQKGDCATKWFLEHKAAKQQAIELSLAENPSMSPTTAVIVALTQACGDLLPR